MDLQLSQTTIPLVANNKHYAHALPFYQLPLSLPPEMTIQQFIKEWIEQIFFSNRKIQTEARVRIAKEIAKFKLFQLSSCSSVYELIRHKIEQIAQKLRNFVDVSFGLLNKEGKHLSRIFREMGNTANKSENDKLEEEQSYLKMLHVPIAKMFVLFYKYICGSLKQVCNLWKIIYSSIQVKDLQKSTFQKSISTFVLEIFSTPGKIFSPLRMYPAMSVTNKYNFVCADTEGMPRRLELARFGEDEMKKILLQKKSKIASSRGKNFMELTDSERRLLQEINGYNYFSKKLMKAQQKLKVDIPFIQELKNKLSSVEGEEKAITASLEQYYQLNEIKAQCMEIKNELLSPFEPNSELLYEIEDNSSQDELVNFYDDKWSENDGSYLQREQILMEYIHAKAQLQPKENESCAKLSSSTANQEHNECGEIKNEEIDIQSDGMQLETLNAQLNSKENQKQEIKDMQNQLQTTPNKQSHGELIQSKMERINSHFQSCSSLIAAKKNEKILRSENSKKYLEEQKQKLEKYRKQLEKEKQQLLREVERFMKQKEKDERDFKRASHCFNFQGNHRHGRPTCKCCNELKKFSLQWQSISSSKLENEKQKLNSVQKQVDCVQRQITNQIYKDMNAEATEDTNTDRNEEIGTISGKKRQKNKKRPEKHKVYRIQQKNSPQSEKVSRQIDEDQAQLIKFMDNLKINDANRVSWNIEESRIESWKERLNKIRNNEYITKNNPKKEQPKAEKSKKKQKR